MPKIVSKLLILFVVVVFVVVVTCLGTEIFGSSSRGNCACRRRPSIVSGLRYSFTLWNIYNISDTIETATSMSWRIRSNIAIAFFSAFKVLADALDRIYVLPIIIIMTMIVLGANNALPGKKRDTLPKSFCSHRVWCGGRNRCRKKSKFLGNCCYL